MCSAGSVVVRVILMLADLHICFGFAKAHFEWPIFTQHSRYSWTRKA